MNLSRAHSRGVLEYKEPTISYGESEPATGAGVVKVVNSHGVIWPGKAVLVPKERQRNEKLAAAIAEAGWSHGQAAIAFCRVATEMTGRDFTTVGRSHVSHWIGGSVPSGPAPAILAEALTRRLGRMVTTDEIGLTTLQPAPTLDWDADTLTTLADLGRGTLDVERRSILRATGYSVATLAIPGRSWWERMAQAGAQRSADRTRLVGAGDLEAVRETVQLFTRIDQRRGGGHARAAVVQGHHRQAVKVAEASLEGRRYADATPRERALLGVVHARALAADGRRVEAARALLRAEDDLSSATAGDDEPGRVFFFGEASLAHETACTLRDLGDLAAATKEFKRSVRTRKAATFTRTHAVTLGYLGVVQARNGSIDEACATWSDTLDVMDGIHSGRARQAVRDMRSSLSVYRAKGIRSVSELDSRAAKYLASAGR